MPKKKTEKSLVIRNSTAEFLTFAYQSGGDGVEVRVQDDTIWLSQKSMGQLFDTSSDNIGLHLKNIFKDNELHADSVTEDFSVVQIDIQVIKRNLIRFLLYLKSIYGILSAYEVYVLRPLRKQGA